MHTLVEVTGSPGPPGSGTTHVPAFLAKLWKLVDETKSNDLIHWNGVGNSFIIRNQARFARELLPLYYKHNNMASFVRQLNMYGFHKVVSVEQGGLRLEKDEMEFAHPFFLRGNESSLELIKRKHPAAKQEETNIVRPDNFQKVLNDVRQMKGRQESMDSKLMTMKEENEQLWRELASLRQKHANQTTILSKILQFLVGVMSNSGNRHIPFKRRMPLMLNGNEHDQNQRGQKVRRTDEQVSGIGPVIRDVTEADVSDEGGGDGSNDAIPKVDSPASPEEEAEAAIVSSILDGTLAPTMVGNQLALAPPPTKPETSPKTSSQAVMTAASTSDSQLALAAPDNTFYIQGPDGQPIKVNLQLPFVMPGNMVGMVMDAMEPAKGIVSQPNPTPLSERSTSLAPQQIPTTSSVPGPSTFDQLIAEKQDLDQHLEHVENGLNGLKELLKGDNYKMDNDTLLGLFGTTADINLNFDLNELDQTSTDHNSGVIPHSDRNMDSYNPSLFELTDDSHFFDDSSNLFLDDELQSMMTTDRKALSNGFPVTTPDLDQPGTMVIPYPSGAVSNPLLSTPPSALTGARKRKGK